ncbi:hypothetical protein H6P81_000193 [Aristolochia fimbriata]|uniref:Uncharacterized protein n=1 Tax=Aristolochia fimbriata TaxID=158543 RepID=A0AAV7F3F0_ARIFI|nr:hypothetical protein H6P81_000193 [Aristolochia fimbriata]
MKRRRGPSMEDSYIYVVNTHLYRGLDCDEPNDIKLMQDDSYEENVMLANGARDGEKYMMDFIFYSRNHFEVVNYLKYHDNFMYLLGKISNHHTPSYHLSLKATFSWLLMQLRCVVGNATSMCGIVIKFLIPKFLADQEAALLKGQMARLRKDDLYKDNVMHDNFMYLLGKISDHHTPSDHLSLKPHLAGSQSSFGVLWGMPLWRVWC